MLIVISAKGEKLHSRGLVTAKLQVNEWVVFASEAVPCVVFPLMRFQAHLTPFQSARALLGHWHLDACYSSALTAGLMSVKENILYHSCESAFQKGANMSKHHFPFHSQAGESGSSGRSSSV